jgi:hypothetical protein
MRKIMRFGPSTVCVSVAAGQMAPREAVPQGTCSRFGSLSFRRSRLKAGTVFYA